MSQATLYSTNSDISSPINFLNASLVSALGELNTPAIATRRLTFWCTSSTPVISEYSSAPEFKSSDKLLSGPIAIISTLLSGCSLNILLYIFNELSG